jgi:hypothetical protein
VIGNGSGSISRAPNGFRILLLSGRKIRGCSSSESSTAKPISGGSGASTPWTHARLTTKTITPEIADSAASTRIDASTVGVSVTPPARRRAIARAAGVQTPPGRYLASIETISACSATRYGTRIAQAASILIQPRMKTR